MATQRLTNDVRTAFVAGVMADVPSVDYQAKIRSAVNKAATAALPSAIKKILADEELAKFITIRGFTLNRHFGVPNGEYLSFRLPAPSDEWLEKIATAQAEPFIKQWVEQDARYHDLRNKLQTIAHHCTTIKQLSEAFPEFAKYLPRDDATATRNLPALANVVSEFVKAGWPKGAKP